MAAGSVLGLQSLRPSFLDDVPTAGREEGGSGACVVTSGDNRLSLMVRYRVVDDDDPEDEDDDLDGDDDDDEEDEEDDEDPDVETWQVTNLGFALKSGMCLTSGAELPRLTRICQLS
jgi:hypothetical protein